jgi:hypothetical protein
MIVFTATLLILISGISSASEAHHQIASSIQNHECITWHTYSEALLKSLANAIVQTDDQVACRVLQHHESDGDDASGKIFYEFGTIDRAASQFLCTLHRDPSLFYQKDFQVAVKNVSACHHFWAPLAYDVDPLGPNIVKIHVEAPELKESPEISVCRYNSQGSDSYEYIGRMIMQGQLFGHCGYLTKSKKELVFMGGDFDALSATPRASPVSHKGDHDAQLRNKIVAGIQKRIDLHLSQPNKDLIASISGYSVEELVNAMNDTDVVGFEVLDRILSTDRFIPHDVLNIKGLTLLRAVLAEQMTLARRRYLGLHHHADTFMWERDGVLLKDFDYYTNERNLQEFDELLQMVAASKSVSASQFTWVERNVTSMANDPQREPHIDTFHSVVKMWVYERGVVTNDTGPLHFMLGSNRNSRGKLQWMYKMSLPPATEAIREPSLRFREEILEQSFDYSMMDIRRPVLPLDCYTRTLVIADTSGIHHRGHVSPGTIRKTMRVSNGNDGGLPRINPFIWDGWERMALLNGEGECLGWDS